jgi:hypothetical protein
MGLSAKWQVMIGAFAFCWLLYFIIPCFGEATCFGAISNLFTAEAVNFVFLTILFLTVSVVAADAADFLCIRVRRLPWFRPRLGEVLVKRGFITKDDLSAALEEQRLAIGDILVQAGKLTARELDQAVEHNRSRAGMRIDEALVELGYASAEDVSWALERSNRRLGKILVEKGLITDSDVRRILRRMWYARFRGL